MFASPPHFWTHTRHASLTHDHLRLLLLHLCASSESRPGCRCISASLCISLKFCLSTFAGPSFLGFGGMEETHEISGHAQLVKKEMEARREREGVLLKAPKNESPHLHCSLARMEHHKEQGTSCNLDRLHRIERIAPCSRTQKPN